MLVLSVKATPRLESLSCFICHPERSIQMLLVVAEGAAYRQYSSDDRVGLAMDSLMPSAL